MGDLCIKTVGTRDHCGTLNPKDPAITSLPNFRSTTVDGWDETIRYYYLAPLLGR